MERERSNNLKMSPLFTSSSVLPFVLILFFLVGCAPKYVDPATLEITPMDREEAEYPPTEEELATAPRLLLPLIVSKGDAVTDVRLKRTLDFIHTSFNRHGNFTALSQDTVEELLSSEENRKFQASNVADAIQLGKSLNAQFVSQMQIVIAESKIVDNIDHYKAIANLTIFTTSSGQVVFKQDVVFDTQEVEDSKRKLKKMVQTYFPLKGYILETRGGRQYAKISLGSSLGIEPGREFLVRDRVVKNEIVSGFARRTVSYPTLALANVSVIKVMEDESWVAIDKDDRSKIRVGHVVFSQPESDSIYH